MRGRGRQLHTLVCSDPGAETRSPKKRQAWSERWGGSLRYGVVWCGVVWCGAVRCDVVLCGVVWCGVVWCGEVWCGAVWSVVMWCGVQVVGFAQVEDLQRDVTDL